VTIRVEDPRFPAKELQVRGSDLVPGGVVEVVLDGPELAPATLLVHLEGTTEALGSDGLVNFWLYETESKSAEELDVLRAGHSPSTFGGHSSSASISPSGPRIELGFRDGTWTLSGVPRARYLVQAVPAAREGGSPPMLLPTTFEVDLRSQELGEHTWLAEEGGLLRLNLSSVPDLRSAELRTLAGRKVRAIYSSGRLGVPAVTTSNGMSRAALFDVLPALPAGDYVLVMTLRSGTTQALPLRVEAGRVNDVAFGPDDL
jgi:hypothetical protein